MPIALGQIRALLEAEEPDYARAAQLGPEALPCLETLVREAEPMLASKAAYLASLIPDPANAAVLRGALARPEAIVRVAAAAAAQNLPGPTADDMLAELVNDQDSGVRRHARAARSTTSAPPLAPPPREVGGTPSGRGVVGTSPPAASGRGVAGTSPLSPLGRGVGGEGHGTGDLGAAQAEPQRRFPGHGVGEITPKRRRTPRPRRRK